MPSVSLLRNRAVQEQSGVREGFLLFSQNWLRVWGWGRSSRAAEAAGTGSQPRAHRRTELPALARAPAPGRAFTQRWAGAWLLLLAASHKGPKRLACL
jgi:hypothetical protein